MAEEKRPGLTVREETDGRLRKLLVDYDGNVLLDETVFAYDDLIHFLDRPVKELRKQIHELKMHKLFEESLDVHVADLRDVVKRTIEITDTWKSGFPEAYFLTRKKLDNVLKTKDDHTAGVLLQVGWQSVQAIEAVYLASVQMRNIMEICFGTTEGMTHHERWERVSAIYPTLHNHAYAVRWWSDGQGWIQKYEMRSLLELYCFELGAVLRSPKRISRCQCCWQYFVPKTNKKTDYCDRTWKDGRTCKEHGPNLKRKDGPAEDRYQLAFKVLSKRFYEREYRAYADRTRALPVPYGSYGDWIEVASTARVEYLNGKISGKKFLQRLNPEQEELDLDRPIELSLAEGLFDTPWEKLVEQNMSFDPSQHFESLQSLELIEGKKSQWDVITAKEQARVSKHGNISLQEKYNQK